MDLNEYTGADVRELSVLSLAYVGDAVFELMVRTRLISGHNATAGRLHKMAKSVVNAGAQAEMYFRIKDMLSEEEAGVFRRGRNAKSATVPKNGSLADYRHATGLEALFGYLYLSGRFGRLREIFEKGIL